MRVEVGEWRVEREKVSGGVGWVFVFFFVSGVREGSR